MCKDRASKCVPADQLFLASLLKTLFNKFPIGCPATPPLFDQKGAFIRLCVRADTDVMIQAGVGLKTQILSLQIERQSSASAALSCWKTAGNSDRSSQQFSAGSPQSAEIAARLPV